jgi:outer membrane biosynthesis protein TonB
MPRLPYLLALALGACAALLVACGAGTKGGIPSASAGNLKSELEDVQQAVENGRCKDVTGQLRQVDDDIDKLPGSVDERLRQRLRDASDGLHRLAGTECSARATQTQTQTTAPTQTQTPPPTATQTTEPTTTSPPPTTTTPPTTTVTPVPPPVAPPVPPPVAPAEPPAPAPGGTPGGGATPEVDPG